MNALRCHYPEYAMEAVGLGLFIAEIDIRLRGLKAVYCAKLHHHNQRCCIFRCGSFNAFQQKSPIGLPL